MPSAGRRRTRTSAQEQDLRRQLHLLESLVEQALDKSPPDLRNAIAAQPHIIRITADLGRRQAVRLANSYSDPLEVQRRLLALAEADGSWGPAATMASALRDQEASRAPAEKGPEDMSHQEMLAWARENALAAPLEVREQWVEVWAQEVLGLDREELVERLRESGP